MEDDIHVSMMDDSPLPESMIIKIIMEIQKRGLDNPAGTTTVSEELTQEIIAEQGDAAELQYIMDWEIRHEKYEEAEKTKQLMIKKGFIKE